VVHRRRHAGRASSSSSSRRPHLHEAILYGRGQGIDASVAPQPIANSIGGDGIGIGWYRVLFLCERYDRESIQMITSHANTPSSPLRTLFDGGAHCGTAQLKKSGGHRTVVSYRMDDHVGRKRIMFVLQLRSVECTFIHTRQTECVMTTSIHEHEHKTATTTTLGNFCLLDDRS
jgi:hypothetical protein